MSKSKKKGKSKGINFDKLRKAERKALKARERELEAALAAVSPKGKKKGKGKKAAKATPVDGPVISDEVPPERAKALKAEKSAKAKTTEAADAVIAGASSPDAVVAAKTAKAAAAEATDDESTESIKARVRTKRNARAALEGSADNVDLDDRAAVKAYNAALAELGGGKFLTSNAERAANDARMAGDDRPLDVLADEAAGGKPAKGKAKKAGRAAADKALATADFSAEALGLRPVDQVVDQVVGEVETERGRVFEAGAPEAVETFGKPSDAPRQLEEGRNGYKIMALNPDGTPDPKTVRQFTRVTTYIDGLDSNATLVAWKLRTLLEGIALDTFSPEQSAGYLNAVGDAMHNRDVAIAKARKADRKGKLGVGELADLESDATKAFKDAVDKIADEALELGGVHEKANKGTNLHALTEVYDDKGLGALDDMLDEGTITLSDYASVKAYGEALEVANIKVLEREVVVVHDDLKRAGRLDRIVLVKLPGTQRAVRCVLDIKSGRLDFGQGKLAQQLEAYAVSKGYDLETGERRDLKLSKAKGLVLHMPQGAGEVHIYVVDLVLGAKGNRIAAEVRAWRNEGKKAIDYSVDLAHPDSTVDAKADAT